MRRSFLLEVLAPFALLATTGCDSDAYTTTVRVDHYREPCETFGPDFCLRVLDATDIGPAISQIDGFEYEPGFVYRLDVLVTAPSDDAGDVDRDRRHYELMSVLEREPIDPDTRFSMELAPGFIERIDSDSFELVTDIPVKCVDASVCRTVARAMNSGSAIRVEFRHAEAGAGFIALAADSG